ncbi:MAG: hypothetical protein LC733_00325 [Actinobacteria bacterium]|nr:hypothetical protein [Actinomycetota bacterium]
MKSPVCSFTGCELVGSVTFHSEMPPWGALGGGGFAGHVSFWWMSRSPVKNWLAIGMTWMPSPAYEPGLVGMKASGTSNGAAGLEMSTTWTPASSHVGSRNALR